MQHDEDKRPVEPLNYSPTDAGKRLGIATRSVYEHIASGELRSFKLGKRRLIPDSELLRFIARKLREAS
jgi:excisionase family DNA binding protein